MAARPIQCQGGPRHGDERMTKRDAEREKRLAEALRDNLKRRKARARGEEADGERADPPSRPGRAGT
jgi:hypothetical protein